MRRWFLFVAVALSLLRAHGTEAACTGSTISACAIPELEGEPPGEPPRAVHRAPYRLGGSLALQTESASSTAPGAEPAAEQPPDSAPRSPAFSLTVATYIIPDTRDYAQPTLTADYEWLHVEGRYNYESYDTASLWLGLNFSIGEKLTLDVTPMVGGVFGDVTGVAPGARISLGFWKLDLYSEGEYFFDTDDHTGNFGYAWSELALTPWEWLRLGLVTQRTNAYDTDVEIQRGLFAGLAYRWISFTTYVFNLDESRQTVVLSVGVSI